MFNELMEIGKLTSRVPKPDCDPNIFFSKFCFHKDFPVKSGKFGESMNVGRERTYVVR